MATKHDKHEERKTEQRQAQHNDVNMTRQTGAVDTDKRLAYTGSEGEHVPDAAAQITAIMPDVDQMVRPEIEDAPTENPRPSAEALSEGALKNYEANHPAGSKREEPKDW